jgi:6,7-dimethyl-8-ribityllumazine synthase
VATNLKNLSDYDIKNIPSAEDMKFGIIISEWNKEITEALFQGAYNTLLKHGARQKNILKKHVPGSFELTLGAQFMAELADPDAVICLGCIIQGETPHFTYICQAVTHGITELNMKYNIPFIFGILTTYNLQQAKDRAGGKRGNKGNEAAVAAIKMVQLHREMKNM